MQDIASTNTAATHLAGEMASIAEQFVSASASGRCHMLGERTGGIGTRHEPSGRYVQGLAASGPSDNELMQKHEKFRCHMVCGIS